jgi:hypothetical protein
MQISEQKMTLPVPVNRTWGILTSLMSTTTVRIGIIAMATIVLR